MVDPVTAKDKATTVQDKVQESWAERTAEWESLAKTSGVKLPKGIDPKNVRVEIGPPMTEEQFKAWRERQKNFAKNFSH